MFHVTSVCTGFGETIVHTTVRVLNFKTASLQRNTKKSRKNNIMNESIMMLLYVVFIHDGSDGDDDDSMIKGVWDS